MLPTLFIKKLNQRAQGRRKCFQVRISKEISTKKVTSGSILVFQPEA